MVVLPFNKAMGDIRQYPNRNLFESIIHYMIDHRYRKSVNLSSWLAEQVELARNTPELVEQALRLKKEDDDLTMQAIFNYVRTKKVWMSDWDKWKTLEYWEDVDVAFNDTYQDCETGALLIYCMARVAGVPAHALYLWCGDVYDPRTQETFGHASIVYKTLDYPLNYAMLDWCFYPQGAVMRSRNQFTMLGDTIHEYQLMHWNDWHDTQAWQKITTNYKRTWFAINEERSYRWFR